MDQGQQVPLQPVTTEAFSTPPPSESAPEAEVEIDVKDEDENPVSEMVELDIDDINYRMTVTDWSFGETQILVERGGQEICFWSSGTQG